MSNRAPTADTVPVRRAVQPSTASNSNATVVMDTSSGERDRAD